MVHVSLAAFHPPHHAVSEYDSDAGEKLLPDEQMYTCDRSKADFTLQRLDITCRCNATHSVVYSHAPHGSPFWDPGKALWPLHTGESTEAVITSEVAPEGWPQNDHSGGARQPPDVLVHTYGGAMVAPPRPANGSEPLLHYLHYIEPPHNLQFKQAPGFDGLVGHRRPLVAGTDVWYPWCTPKALWTGIEAWHYDSSRSGVGVWVDNCFGHNYHWRTSVIDALVGDPSLRAVSYGRCRRNSPKELWDSRVFSDRGNSCRRHRLMLAVENNACRDWVSLNLCQAVIECGAIPIIKSTWGAGQLLPDYRALYGDIPLVNASRPGWKAEVREIVQNNTYYREKLRAWKRPPEHKRQRAHLPNFHCQWHEAISHAAALHRRHRTRTAVWAQCACPRGQLAEFDEDMDAMDNAAYRRAPAKWLPGCATPSY